MSLTVSYRRAPDAQESMHATMKAAQAGPGLAETEAGAAKMKELMAKMNEAMARGDKAEYQRLQQQFQQAQMQVYGQRAQAVDADEILGRKGMASVSISVNELLHALEIPNPKASHLAPPKPINVPGATVAFRAPDWRESVKWHNGVTYLFLGNWTTQHSPGHITVETRMPKGARDTEVHAVKILVEADDKRVEELISALDLKALQALIR